MIGEGPSEGARGGDVGGDARAGDAEPVEKCRGGKTGGPDLDNGGVGVADVRESAGDREGRRVGRAGGRPAAVDVLKAVEVTGCGTKALEIDVEGLGGDEVGPAAAGKLKMGLDGAAADCSLGVRREGHITAKTGVAAKEDAGCGTKGDIAPLTSETDGDLTERSCAAERALKLEGAGVGDIGIGAGRMGL
jgi:hypothetical protein